MATPVSSKTLMIDSKIKKCKAYITDDTFIYDYTAYDGNRYRRTVKFEGSDVVAEWIKLHRWSFLNYKITDLPTLFILQETHIRYQHCHFLLATACERIK